MKQLRFFFLLAALLFIFGIQISVAQDDPETGDSPQRDEPVIEVDPNMIEHEIDAGITDQVSINVSNTGDQLLRIETELVLIDQPDDQNLEHMKVLIVTEGFGNGGEHVMLEAAEAAGIAEENVLEVGSREIRDIDIYEWDVIVWSDDHENPFYQEYNWFRERYEEWIDEGGILILNLYTAYTQPILELPGGFFHFYSAMTGWARQNVRENGFNPDNPIVAGFAEDEEDDVPVVIVGDECSRTFFWRELLQDNEDVTDLQIIYNQGNDIRYVTMMTYGFGDGFVCASTLNLSGLWYERWNDGGADLTARNELIWADWIGDTPWATFEDHPMEIDPNEAIELTIEFNGAGLVSGDYLADLLIESNDENNAEIVVTIELFVTETPDISAKWAHNHGFPRELDWNISRDDIFTGHEYETYFRILNHGSGELQIDEIQIIGEGSEYLSIDMEDRLDPIPGQSDVELDLTLAPEEAGDYEVLLILFSNDPDEDEYDFPIVFEVSDTPSIVVDPEQIIDEFPGAAIVEHELTVHNNGQGIMRFNTDVDIIDEPERDLGGRAVRSTNTERRIPENRIDPMRDDPGDILHEFQLENDMVDNPDDLVFTTITHGLAWDSENEWMWAVNTFDRRMIAINPREDYQTEEFWMMNILRPWDMAYYDGTLYALEAYNTWLTMWDREGNQLGRLNLDCEGAIVYGVAIDPINELIIVLGHRIVGRTHPLFVFTIDGELIASMDCIKHHFNNMMSISIEWVPTHDFGKLWVRTAERLWQLDIDTENWEVNGVVQHFPTIGLHFGDGFAHDGENFWITATENNLMQIIDDGINELWITVEPIAGDIEADDEAILTVTLDGRSQLPGEYEAEIIISSNDPENPQVVVPVILSIEPAPFIAVNWPTEAGFDEEPQIIDWNMYFPEVYIEQSYGIPIKVQNLGHEVLEVSDIFSENELFSAEPTEFNLEPREIREVLLRFEPGEVGLVESEMIFRSNDPNREEHAIPLIAEAILPPIIVVEPVVIEDDLISGDFSQIPINVANEGDSELRWRSDFVFLNEDEDERDNNRQRNVRAVNQRNHSRSGPRRDIPNGRFMIFQRWMAHGWVVENVFARVEDLDYDWINTIEGISNVDFFDYDAIWIESGGQGEAFDLFWDANIENFEEYISEGYSMYLEQGLYPGLAPGHVAPGGLVHVNDPQPEGILNVGPEDNWLVEQMEWEERRFFEDRQSFGHVVYPVEALENIDDSDGYQVIVVGSRNERPVIAEYSYGNGNVIVSGATCGRQWNDWNVEDSWGSCSEVMLEYLLRLGGGPPWAALTPSDGTLQAGEDFDVILDLDADGLFTGEYTSELHFLSNDPENNDQIVEITLNVTGFPVPEIEWDEEFGFPDEVDFNLAFEPLYNRGEYPIEVMVANIGTDDMHILEIDCDNENFRVDWNPDIQDVVPGDEEIYINFILSTEEIGEFRGNVTLTFDEADDLDPIEIPVVAITVGSPILDVDTDVIVEDLLSNEVREHEVVISNEGEGVLEWRSDAAIIEEPDRDNSRRSVRGICARSGAEYDEGNYLPYRDEPGDVIEEIRNPLDDVINTYRHFAYDEENNWMWIAYMGIQGNLSTFVALDLDNNYEVVAEFPGPIQMVDICFFNGIFYITDRGLQTIHKYDREGNDLGDIGFDGWFGGGIAASEELGLVFIQEDWPGGFDRPIHVYTIEEDGNFGEHVGDIENYNELMLRHNADNNRGKNLMWVDDHDDGSFWIGTGGQDGNVAWQFTVDRESWEAELAQSFYSWDDGMGTEMDDLGHDGTNLWSVSWSNGAQWRSDIRIIDDGLNEHGWLLWADQSGEIDPNENQVITVTIDTRGLISGDYSAELYFFSNDPIVLDGPDHTIEINLTVTQVPNIVVIPGGDEQEPVDFEIAYFGYAISRTVVVQNIGTGQLSIEEVLRDDDNPDFFVLDEDLDDLVIEGDSGEELQIWYNPDPERGGEQEATLVFMTNDPNREEGYPVRCVVSIGAFSAPELVLNPQELEIEMEQGDVAEEIVNVTNNGESDLHFTTRFEIISQPGLDSQVRSVRSISENSGFSSDNFPQRDQPQGRGILIQESCRFYDHEFEQYFSNIEGLDYERYEVWEELEDLDLNEFDFMWIGNYETDIWTRDHNNFIERIEEFVDGGGVIYHSSGAQQFNVTPLHPGGLEAVGNIQLRQTLCPIQLGPEDNYFINYMNENDPFGWPWGVGQRLIGFREIAPFTFGYFRMEDLEEIENSDWFEVMVMGNEIEEPVAVTYRYGSGYCFVNTALDGYHHRWAESAQWGRTGEAVIWYMDFLSAELDTLSIEPSFGTLNPGEDQDLLLTVNSGGLLGGEYQVELHFESNDPENPDQVVDILINTTGIPELTGNPLPEPLEGAEIIELEGPNWIGQEYTLEVIIENVGTQVVNIEEIEVSDPENWDFIFPDEEMIVQPHQEVIAFLVYHPIETAEHQVEIRMQTDAANVEDGFFWWEASANAVLAPEMTVELPEGEDALNVIMDIGDDPQERTIVISNTEGDPRDDLAFSISTDAIENEPMNDQPGRKIRSIISEISGPVRDDPGDVLEQFDVQVNQTSDLTSVGDQIWGCSYNQSRLYAINRETGEAEQDVNVERFPMALTFDGNSLWVTSWGAPFLYQYDLEGDLVETHEFELRTVTALAYLGNDLLLMKANENNRIYVVSNDGLEIIRTINQLPGFDFNAWTYKIEFVPDHVDGQLWGLNANQLFQARITENWETEHVQTINVEQDWAYRGLCHDGENFWFGSMGNIWSVVDDGIIEGSARWLTIAPENGAVAPGESVDIILTFDPSEMVDNLIYRAMLMIESDDPENPLVEIPVSLAIGIPLPIHFGQDNPETEEIDGWVENEVRHILEITEVTLNDEPIPLGWEIGVLTPQGVLAGGAVWFEVDNFELIAYGDNPEIEQITGFGAGDRFDFRIWDEVNGVEYQADATFEDGPAMWIPNRRSVLSLGSFTIDELTLNLIEGWNMISINVDPLMHYNEEDDPGPDVVDMFEELRIDEGNHRIILLKNEIGRFWTTEWGFNNIPYWELTQGYQAKLSEAAEITFRGPAIDADTDVPLEPSWNIIAYLPDYELDASSPDFHVLSPIIESVGIAKDFEGRFMVPEQEFSNMAPWTAGQGYQVRIDNNEPVILNYPEEAEQLADQHLETPHNMHWGVPVNTGENMSVLIKQLDGLDPDVLYQVAAFSSSEMLVGNGDVVDGRCGISIWGDDHSTEIKDGLDVGETFFLRLWDGDRCIESELQVGQIHNDDKLVYEPNGLKIVKSIHINHIPMDYYLAECFPNPFNNITRLTYGLPTESKVSISVFDINGRLVQNLLSNQLVAGSHDLTWNAKDASAGVYIINMKAKSVKEKTTFKCANKVILIK